MSITHPHPDYIYYQSKADALEALESESDGELWELREAWVPSHLTQKLAGFDTEAQQPILTPPEVAPGDIWYYLAIKGS